MHDGVRYRADELRKRFERGEAYADIAWTLGDQGRAAEAHSVSEGKRPAALSHGPSLGRRRALEATVRARRTDPQPGRCGVANEPGDEKVEPSAYMNVQGIWGEKFLIATEVHEVVLLDHWRAADVGRSRGWIVPGCDEQSAAVTALSSALRPPCAALAPTRSAGVRGPRIAGSAMCPRLG